LRVRSPHANIMHDKFIWRADIADSSNFLWGRQHIGAHLSLPVQLTIRRNVLASVLSLNIHGWWLTESSHY